MKTQKIRRIPEATEIDVVGPFGMCAALVMYDDFQWAPRLPVDRRDDCPPTRRTGEKG